MTIARAVHSQAFGFMSFLQNGVDPRTGQYTASISLPELNCNELSGPVIPLGLGFNPLNTLDSGFGLGWNMNLTQFTPHNNMLSLSTGETFKLTSTMPDGTPVFKEKKLDSFHFKNNGDGSYQVQHKSGLIEELVTGGSNDDRAALPHRIYAPGGHMVSLTYDNFRGGQLLKSVSDAHGMLLQINRNASGSTVEILLHPQGGPDAKPLARYELKLDTDGWLTELVLPTAELASWRFQYELIRGILCIKELKTPVGGRETVDYLDGGHLFPGTALRPNLPRVTRHRTYPGFAQPMMEVTYLYDSNDQNRGHNFIGNGANVSWADDGLDSLYKVTHTYNYGTVAELRVDNQIVRSVVRTFNRFHLLTEEKTTQNHCVKRILSTYYAVDDIFEMQVAQFQLAKKVETRWEMDNDNKGRSEAIHTVFDVYGNLREQVDSDNIKTTYTYYPKGGAAGCPPDPQGFERNLWETTVYPAPDMPGAAPVLLTRNRYIALDPLASSGLQDWLVIGSETLLQVEVQNETKTKTKIEIELQRTERHYNNLPADAVLHGRPASKDVTINAKTTKTTYAYSKPMSRLAGETVLQTVETLSGFDHQPGVNNVQKIITMQHSLLHGEPLISQDDNDVIIRYRYDALRRVTSETVSPEDTAFEATRTYSYFLTSRDGQQASQEMTDVKNVTTRTRFDGLNRAIWEERQNADSSTRADANRRTWIAAYDALGNLETETEYDWLDEEELPLTSLYTYDDWGQQHSVTGPDDVTSYEESDPIGTSDWKGAIQRSWQQSPDAKSILTGVSVTCLNALGKPVTIARFNTLEDKQPVSLHQYIYDGLGRTFQEIDAGDAKTQYRYDVFNRMIENILPGNPVVRRHYAQHSTDNLPTEISVDSVVLGAQAFDGLSRMTSVTTGGRKQIFAYLPGQSQPATVTTAKGELINYEYQPQIGDEPRQRRLPDSTADYTYDKKNARLLDCQEQGLTLKRTWFSTGELKSEERKEDGHSYAMHYRYSRNGRLLSYTDVFGQTQRYDYDAAGRLIRTELESIVSNFTYDGLGRTQRIETHDSASAQHIMINLTYDKFGREIVRTFDLDGVIQELTQVYNAVDALTQRTLCEGAKVLRDETYDYDARGRLVIYACAGSQPPIDPYDQTIITQVFGFDAINNLTRVMTEFPGGTNVARYTYDRPDKTQLSKIVNSNPAYPAEITLEYDENGNLTRDEGNRSLQYDALNRLISVSGLSDETPSGYQYDALDALASRSASGGEERRFYQNGTLSSQMQGTQQHTFLRGNGSLLAELQDVTSPQILLLGCDNKNSVLHEISHGSATDIAYSAYGQRSAEMPVNTQLGYNGELSEAQAGWYLLGNGYRVFNPLLMRFHSPDSLSPFGDGGLNPYAYCDADPINNTDPTGHTPWAFWLLARKTNPALNTVQGRADALAASQAAKAGLPEVSPQQAARTRLSQEIAASSSQPASSGVRAAGRANSRRLPTPRADYDDEPVAGPSRTAEWVNTQNFSTNKTDSVGATVATAAPVVASTSRATALPRAAPRPAKKAPVSNPNAAEISRLEDKLDKLKNVRRSYMLDENKIRKLNDQIASLRNG